MSQPDEVSAALQTRPRPGGRARRLRVGSLSVFAALLALGAGCGVDSDADGPAAPRDTGDLAEDSASDAVDTEDTAPDDTARDSAPSDAVEVEDSSEDVGDASDGSGDSDAPVVDADADVSDTSDATDAVDVADGSGDAEVREVTVELGTGYTEFVPLAAGDTVVIHEGPQGGYHLFGAVRGTGFDRSSEVVVFARNLSGRVVSNGGSERGFDAVDGQLVRFGITSFLAFDVVPEDVDGQTWSFCAQVYDPVSLLEACVDIVVSCCEYL